jgi:hypothetical protein
VSKGVKRLGILALLVGSTALWLWIAAVRPRVHVEHGPMENFQAGCLALGGVLLGHRAWRSGKGAERAWLGALALLYVTFLFLELDTGEFDWPAVNTVLQGVVRNAWLGLLWSVAGLALFRHRRDVPEVARRWLGTSPGKLLLTAGLFWAAGSVVDKTEPFLLRSQNMLVEEIWESNAALLMALAAVIGSRRAGPVSSGITTAGRTGCIAGASKVER